jgi:hypothetical protein
VVDALGGVDVCVPSPVAAGTARRTLAAGSTAVDGAAAADWLAPGAAGSDVSGVAVAGREQTLLGAVLRAAGSTATSTRPLTLARLLARASSALTVDRDTTVGDLRSLAGSLGGLPASAVHTASLPVAAEGHVPAGSDRAYVLLDAAGTRSMVDDVLKHGTLPDAGAAGDGAGSGAEGGEPAPADGTTAGGPTDGGPTDGGVTDGGAGDGGAVAAADGPLTVAPGGVPVDVLNGTAQSGLAADVAKALQAGGFPVGTVGTEPGTVNQTVVRYGAAVRERARTVAAALPGAVLEPAQGPDDAVQLVLGPGAPGVVPVQVGQPATVQEVAAAPAADPAACS